MLLLVARSTVRGIRGVSLPVTHLVEHIGSVVGTATDTGSRGEDPDLGPSLSDPFIERVSVVGPTRHTRRGVAQRTRSGVGTEV